MGNFTSLKIISIGLALVACHATAQANVGDTLEQLRQRYGSAKDMGGQMLFEVRLVNGQFVPARSSADTENHFSVNVYFDNDRSAMEIFTRNTSDPVKAEMTQADIDAILAAADDGMTWNALQLPNDKLGWLRSDSKLIARYSPNKTGKIDDASVLVIMLNSK